MNILFIHNSLIQKCQHMFIIAINIVIFLMIIINDISIMCFTYSSETSKSSYIQIVISIDV